MKKLIFVCAVLCMMSKVLFFVTADVEIHILDMLSFGSAPENYNVLTEISKIRNVPVISFFDKGEGDDISSKFRESDLKVETIPGDHHFGGDFKGLAPAFLNNILQ